MGFSPLSLHQLTKLSHLPSRLIVVYLVAGRIVPIADSEMPLSWRGHRSVSFLQVSVEGRADRRSLPLGVGRGSCMPSGGVISLASLTMTSSA